MKNKNPLDVIAETLIQAKPTPLEKAILLILMGEDVDEETLKEAREEALKRNVFVKDTPLSDEEKHQRLLRQETRQLFKQTEDHRKRPRPRKARKAEEHE